MTLREHLSKLDRIWPERGPCGICGGPDARHRLWDAIEGQARTKDGPHGTARWMDVSLRQVLIIMAAYDEARFQHRPLPGRYPLPPRGAGAARRPHKPKVAGAIPAAATNP